MKNTQPETTTRTRKDPKDWNIGQLAVYNKLLKKSQFLECRRIQKEMATHGFAMPLGQVLVQKYYLDQATVRALIKAKSDMAGPQFDPESERVHIVKLTPREHEILVGRIREQKLVAPEQIDECFDIQCQLETFGIDKDLGEILLEKGYVSERVVADILNPHHQTKARLQKEVIQEESRLILEAASPGPSDDPQRTVFRRGEKFELPQDRQVLFGQIAVKKGVVTEDQLEECLFVQHKLKELGVIKRIGEVFVEKGIFQKEVIKRILQLQKQLHGKIRWIDKNQTVSQKREDVLLQQVLLKNEILGPEEVSECLYVQQVMRKLGIEKNLAGVIVDKEYLDKEVVRGILKEFKKAQDAKKAEARDLEDRQAEGFLFADVTLKNAYLDILESGKRDDLSASVDQQRDPLRSIQSVRVIPLWPIAVLVAVLVMAGLGWAIIAGTRSADVAAKDPGADERDARRPTGVDTGRRTDPPVDDPGRGPDDPPQEDAHLVELRKATAALRFAAEDGALHDEKKSLVLAAGEALQVPSSPNLCWFAFRAHFWLPAGAVLRGELFYRGEQSAGHSLVLTIGEDGMVENWFGPFVFEPPTQILGEFGHPWALCGPYTLRFTFHAPNQDESVRRNSQGNPFLDENGTAVVEHVFFYPGRESYEVQAIEQEKVLTERLKALLEHTEAGQTAFLAQLERFDRALEAEGTDREGLRQSFQEVVDGRLAGLDEVRRALGNLRDNLLAVPQPSLFRLFAEYVEALERFGRSSVDQSVERRRSETKELQRMRQTLSAFLG